MLNHRYKKKKKKKREKTASFQFKALLSPSSLSLPRQSMEATYNRSNTNVKIIW